MRDGGQRREPESQSCDDSALLLTWLSSVHVSALHPKKLFLQWLQVENILELLVSGTEAPGPEDLSPLPFLALPESYPLGLLSPVFRSLHPPSSEPPSLICLCPLTKCDPLTAATIPLERLPTPSKHRVLCLEVFSKGIPWKCGRERAENFLLFNKYQLQR